MLKLCRSRLSLLSMILACSSALAANPNPTPASIEIARVNRAKVAELIQNESKIIGLEMIVADGTDNAFYSRFGHAMIHFVSNDQDFYSDYVIGFAANVDTPALDPMKGLIGGYQVTPLVKSTQEFWKEYVVGESRALKRVMIPTTPASRHRLIETLNDWNEHPEKMGDYTFLSNNCAGVLSNLFEQAGFPRLPVLIQPKIPVHLPNWLAMNSLAPYAPLMIDSPTPVLEKAAQLLGLDIKRFAKPKNWPQNAAQILNAGLNDLEAKRLILAIGMKMPFQVRAELGASHNYLKSGVTLNEAMGFKKAPEKLYEICEDLACAKEIITIEESFWQPEEWKEARRLRDFAYARAFQKGNTEEAALQTFTYQEDLGLAPPAMTTHPENLRHNQLLLQAGITSK